MREERGEGGEEEERGLGPRWDLVCVSVCARHGRVWVQAAAEWGSGDVLRRGEDQWRRWDEGRSHTPGL